MNIIIYYEQFSFGGVDKHLYELINNWPNKRDFFTIITNQNNKGFKRIKTLLKKKTIKIIYFNSFSYSCFVNFLYENKISFLRFVFYFFQPIFLLLSVAKFSLLLKKFNKNSVILSSNGSYPGSWANIAMLIAAKFYKINKRVLLVHHEASYSRVISKPYDYFIDKLVSISLTNLICVSKATLSTIKIRRKFNYKHFKTQVIHNDIKIFEKNLKKKLFIPLRKKYLLFGILGRTEAYKGHEDVLYGISQINLKYRDRIRLLIIGEKDLPRIKFLKNLATKLKIRKNIVFVGYLPCNSQTIINNLDAVIMATRNFEGFGYTALEAIKLGKPLITTNVGAIKEFVSEQYAEIIKPKKIKKFTSTITKTILHYKFYKKRAKIYKKIHANKFEMSRLYRSFFSEKI